ncbi:DUF6211 family protein [Streptomyces sp. NBC_01454]
MLCDRHPDCPQPGDIAQLKRGNSLGADHTDTFVIVEDLPPTGRHLVLNLPAGHHCRADWAAAVPLDNIAALTRLEPTGSRSGRRHRTRRPPMSPPSTHDPEQETTCPARPAQRSTHERTCARPIISVSRRFRASGPTGRKTVTRTSRRPSTASCTGMARSGRRGTTSFSVSAPPRTPPTRRSSTETQKRWWARPRRRRCADSPTPPPSPTTSRTRLRVGPSRMTGTSSRPGIARSGSVGGCGSTSRTGRGAVTPAGGPRVAADWPTPTRGDERLALARQAIAANPGAKNAELIPQLQEQTEKAYSRPTWNLILKSARDHPEE